MNTYFRFGILILALLMPSPMVSSSFGQDETNSAKLSSSIGDDGTGTIVVEARGQLPKPPVFFMATAKANVQVNSKQIEQTIDVTLKVVQGAAATLSLGLTGDDRVVEVKGEKLKAWSVRKEGDRRFLDLNLFENTQELQLQISLQSRILDLRSIEMLDLTHLTPGNAIGFTSSVELQFAPEVEGSVSVADGFLPLKSEGDNPAEKKRFQTSTGGQLKLVLNRAGAARAEIELTDTTIEGEVHANGNSVLFQYRTTASVSIDHAELTILSGNAALSVVPTDRNYRVRLVHENGVPVYKLSFPKSGTFPVAMDFVAALNQPSIDGRRMDFAIAASAVVPLTIKGLSSDLEFHRDQQSVVPQREENSWRGFLPASGRALLTWKSSRQTGEGKLFFSSTGRIESQVGAGLLRQDHLLDFQILQGSLPSIKIGLDGPGEILDVQGGTQIVGWNVLTQDDNRVLEITLSQPITGTSQIKVRSQTALGAFPVTIQGLRLNPIGAIRHSGHLRVSNVGSVRLQPTELRGLTQLAPDQYPGDPIEARQTFVYRFPASDYAFSVVADSVEPEVNISELIVYQLAETDRVINADIELDVREAAIREWNFGIPADYSVVAVRGANVADYIAATTVNEGQRNLKVVFKQDVFGRHLVSMRLEKSEVASAGNWVLPRIDYPDAKSIRGDIGIVTAPGFRMTTEDSKLLVEKPISLFPKPSPYLQQAYRIREPQWSATMRIEPLERSVQSDVFHLYSLNQETVYGSALINYFITGSPVSEWQIDVPVSLGNVLVDGQNVRTWRREGERLIVSLHQPVMGAYTLLVTFEEKPDKDTFAAGQVSPVGVQSERGYVQVVSPMQVEIDTLSMSKSMLSLDPLELPAEFRLLTTAPPLGTWQYTNRPFDLNLKIKWFEPGSTVDQVVEFSEANSRVSADGELVTDMLYYVKSRGQRTMKIKLPGDPVKLWAVSVNGLPVTARQAGAATLIPLPSGADPNTPVEVRLRLGKTALEETNAELALPIVFAPVLKTQWNISGGENHVLIPTSGSVSPPVPVARPSGFQWIANRCIPALLLICLLAVVGTFVMERSMFWRILGLACLIGAMFVAGQSANLAFAEAGSPQPLQLSLPVLATEEAIELTVRNIPLWRVNLSWTGVGLLLGGIVALFGSLRWHMPLRYFGVFLLIAGVVLQGNSAPWFFGLLALTILLFSFIRPAWRTVRDLTRWFSKLVRKPSANETDSTSNPIPPSSDGSASITTAVLFFAILLSSANQGFAKTTDDFAAADSMVQQWQLTHKDARLKASCTVTLTGSPGDRFLLLKAPAVLTQFEGKGLRINRSEISGEGLCYVISIPLTDDQPTDDDKEPQATTYTARYEYQLEAIKPTEGLPVLTGNAAVQEVSLNYDEAGWEIVGPTAIRIEPLEATETSTAAKILLGPGPVQLILKPKSRDVTAEKTQFFVEAASLYLPGPGVVDGRHRFKVRTSQGQVSVLQVQVPDGLAVSSVTGPVGSWQFDADTGGLTLTIEPAQSQAFEFMIETQRSLDPLPTDIAVAPLRVTGANGEVGLVALAFGAEARPEKVEPRIMTIVNSGDFDASLITNPQSALHCVYRYGTEGGELAVRVAPVASEVRVTSKQVLSLGDERVLLACNVAAEITRAGLFQLSFPLPEGLEVESLTGDALHHWSELNENGKRSIVMHLNGKTIGTHLFSLALTGAALTEMTQWQVPRFELNEASRQTGELVVRPTTGLRLRTVSRQNLSETDPREIGGDGVGALAFRLLQRDWNLVLGLEKLDPWVTGQVLHEIVIREGQTRSTLMTNFNIQNASIASMRIELPISNEDEIKTLRASGSVVSDLIRTAADSNIWEVRFKRRVVGKLQFQIEYERRGDRTNDEESLTPVKFPDARQLSYYFAVRSGGRLELEHSALTQGWQRIDWNTVPQTLRESLNRNAPAFSFRTVEPLASLKVQATRHSLADGLKLRVAEGALTTVLSPTGDQLTAVDVVMEVIQRSSLSVSLPQGGELFSIFVNGESVNSIRPGREGGANNAWQFYILPGIDDRTARVRFVYSVPGTRLKGLELNSPQLNVPLENIQWNVIAPQGFELSDNDGNLELRQTTNKGGYDRDSYLSAINGKRQIQAQQATQLLEQANQLLQAGEQSKARWALNSVANQYALDAASNEDARVQLENLQTQQAIVGLNTRRQRLFLDNSDDDFILAGGEQMRQAAAANPVLQSDQLNFRPQELSQLLRGNSSEDNAVLQQIATRLVQHQHTTEPAPQAFIISLPEEGEAYTFARSVQVAENAPLELELDFRNKLSLQVWQIVTVILLLLIVGGTLAYATARRTAT